MKNIPFCLLVLLMVGCSGSTPPEPEPAPDLQAAPPEISATEDGYLSIAKQDLEKDYLLQTSFINEFGEAVDGSPTSFGQKSRVIYFTKKQEFLYMVEVEKPYLTSEDLPANLVLAGFPIKTEDEIRIVFDFNAGMKNLFLVDEEFSKEEATTEFNAKEIPISFLKEVSQDKKRITIRQIAQVNIKNKIIPAEIIYYLEKYQPDPVFQSTLLEDMDRIGYFQSALHIRPKYGNYESYITKWNINQPIIYHLSSNTPPELIQAIKDGVLYWNKVFGSKVVDAQMAPDGITAPNPDYNIIQWVPNHGAGLSYAGAQVDPLTGQILHAQIYLTSAFQVRTLAQLDQQEKIGEEQHRFGLQGFNSSQLCDYPIFSSYSPPLLIRSGGASPETLLKVVQDYIRHVVAHEVGHTLGLRHNFAASTSSELLPSEIVNQLDHYFTTGEIHLEQAVTSSVMDYLPREESILSGGYIAQENSKPYSYDVMAIQAGYFQKEPSESLVETVFCSDEIGRADNNSYADCVVFDHASHPLLADAYEFETVLHDFSKQIAQKFLIGKTNFDPKYRKPAGEIALSLEESVMQILEPLTQVYKVLKEDMIQSLLVEREIGTITDLNKAEANRKTDRWIDEAVRKQGGFAKLLPSIQTAGLYKIIGGYEKEFARIVDNPKFKKGTTYFGEAYEFTDAEIAVMKKKAKALFDALPEKILEGVTAILAGDTEVERKNGPIPYRNLQDLKGLEATLGNWAEFLITEGAEKEPTFSPQLRLSATGILRPEQGPTETWQKENRERILQILMDKLATRYGKPVDQLSADELDPTEAQIIAKLMLIEKYPPPSEPASN